MEDPGENSLHQAFFGGYCALVCGLLPLRAAGALHDELRGNTIDTLILTRLTGWRITLGKWVAVVAQQLLATVTVLPYLIVRYFAGGIDVPMELAWLGIFLLAGHGLRRCPDGFFLDQIFSVPRRHHDGHDLCHRSVLRGGVGGDVRLPPAIPVG